jgi:hypothetical protein
MNIYYFASWTDSGFLLGCDHEHQTVAEAVDCNSSISHAGSYVVAVENDVLRALTDIEDAEFQRTPRKQPQRVELQYEASGYAVMVRVRFVDGWGWDTWMRFDTYEQAAAHARKGNKIVPFGSVEWNALRQSRKPALPAPTAVPQNCQQVRCEGETLVEFVSRLVPSPLDQHDLADREDPLPVSCELLRPAGTKPETLVELVLGWINEWEVRVLEEVYSLLVSARIKALRRHVRKNS